MKIVTLLTLVNFVAEMGAQLSGEWLSLDHILDDVRSSDNRKLDGAPKLLGYAAPGGSAPSIPLWIGT